MKYIKVLTILFISTFLFLVYAENGYASSISPPTTGTPSEDLIHGKGSTEPKLFSTFSNFLVDGECAITLKSSTIAMVSGRTSVYSSVDTVGVDLYLQRWEPATEQWKNILNVGQFKNANHTIASGTKDIKILSGYYYRIQARHWAIKKGVIEQEYSLSTFVYAK
ncbi:DUF6147 family protein [Fredinandcohnia quinoae]|uniref:DUF6147 family protein n=1 Tax=Fredinandcohnia quinoae TaxID=2918902 RepID=A0AAW5E7Z3_9BACI|nr:DUF6147 family protein [Fredinandcohnia sp. SECRCQ15]MCH1627049.1 DUF6147 family protein [Fredinandcohnia sp. SECRCQ15]